MSVTAGRLEPLYSIREIAALLGVSRGKVRGLFLNRPGLINLSDGEGRPSWRIPESVVLEVMVEHGYNGERARELLAGRAQ